MAHKLKESSWQGLTYALRTDDLEKTAGTQTDKGNEREQANRTQADENGHAFQCSNQRTNMSKVTSETLLEEPVAILGLENRGISHKVMSERLPLQIAARCF